MFGKGVGITVLLAVVFYNSLWAMLPLLIVCGLYLRLEYHTLLRKKELSWNKEFQSGIQAISAALRVGYSLENALVEARKDVKNLYPEGSPILRELDYMIRQLHVRVPVEQALLQMAERTGDEEAENFALVCSMAKHSGGDMISVIQRAVNRISEKMERIREAETLISAKKMEFQIMSAIPLGMLLYMRLSFPEFMKILYGNVAGILFMSVCLIVYLAAYVAGNRIASPEV